MASGVYMAAQLHLYTVAFLAVCAVGLSVSGYMYHIERKLESELWYEPACDINQKISCSKAANSAYSKIFMGIPNALVGLYFYAALLVLLLGYLLSHCYMILLLITAASITASVFSIYLGWRPCAFAMRAVGAAVAVPSAACSLGRSLRRMASWQVHLLCGAPADVLGVHCCLCCQPGALVAVC
jgi:uncharacterized membrane protein